jgi:tetratricopeptide (TPR) repeat protein
MFVEIRDTLAIVKGLITMNGSQFSFTHTLIKKKGQWRLLKSEFGKLEIFNTHLTDVTIREVSVTNEATANRLIKEGVDFSPRQIPILEKQLLLNPENISARVRLLGYYFNSGIKDFGPEATHAARLRHILWLIQNHPENIVNRLSETTIDSSGHALADAEGFVQAKKLWIEQIELKKNNTQVLKNIAWYFKLSEKAIAINCLKQAMLLDPNDVEISGMLGYTYAITVLGITMVNSNGLPMGQNPADVNSDLAKSAINDLRTTKNIVVINIAANVISQYGSMIQSMFKNGVNQDELTEELLQRSIKLDPNNLDAVQILIQFYTQKRLISKTPEDKVILANNVLKQVDIFIKLSKDHGSRYISVLNDASKLAIDEGSFEKAKRFATEVLSLITDPPVFKNGEYFHDGNMILGRVALHEGNIELAKKDLLKAGHTPGGGVLSSFGPNMTLAKELSDRGERITVIAYLELCKSFWRSHNNLDIWIQTLKEGKTPDFGGNMVY